VAPFGWKQRVTAQHKDRMIMRPIELAFQSLQDSIGADLGVSEWVLVDQRMIDAFAAVTSDHQFIHVDPARARAETPFGGTIAHGFLTLSLASRMAYDCIKEHPGQVMSVNYGLDKIRFLSPVHSGSRIRGRFTANGATRKSDTQLLQRFTLVIEIEGDEKPALMADWLSMVVFEKGEA
jgi:acyl dehydratase